MEKECIETLEPQNQTVPISKAKRLWDAMMSTICENGTVLREAYGNSEEIENVLTFANSHMEPSALEEFSNLLLLFVEKHLGQLKSNKVFLSIVKQYVNVVKASNNAQLAAITNKIIKTISSEKEVPKEIKEVPVEPAVQMWSSKESLFKIIAEKVPKKGKFLKYFENVFAEIKNSYTIYDEENFESFFVRKFLMHTFNTQAFAEMDTFIELGKININMPFDLHEQGDKQITLAHQLAQFLDCDDCYHLTRRFINRINFKAVDRAGNTFMHHAVMSQWEHDLQPFIKKSDLFIKNKKGLTCKDLDSRMVKNNAKSVFS